jgi:hypothetical protein
MHSSRVMRGIVATVTEDGLGHSKFLDPPLHEVAANKTRIWSKMYVGRKDYYLSNKVS